jgi:two-component system cell cycle sensor histidine kinase/response regulator CckA
VWLATGKAVAGFAGGAGAGALWLLGRAAADAPEEAEPDWSVTVAAIEGDLLRWWTGRGVWSAPMDHMSGPSGPGRLLAPGEGGAAVLDDGPRGLARRPGHDRGPMAGVAVAVTRAGRGEAPDLAVRSQAAPMPAAGGYLRGRASLWPGGFSAALVQAEGILRNEGFAAGDGRRRRCWEPFVGLLTQDEHDRHLLGAMSCAVLTLFYLPLSDPDHPADPAAQQFMILVDHGVGLGGGGEVSTAVHHLEALRDCRWGWRWGIETGGCCSPIRPSCAGRARGAAAPTYPTDLVVQEDKAALADAIRRFGHGPATSGDVAIRLAAQPDDPVSLSIAGVRGLGEAAVLLGLTDTTEETRLKRQVAQATKMQAVGQLAGGVAHDFNNVLTAVIGTCDLMLLRHTPGDSTMTTFSRSGRVPIARHL